MEKSAYLVVQTSVAMKEHRITTIRFEGELQEREIPSFRGAVMAMADNDPLYHNHADGEGFQFRYPLIQYKVLDEMPAVVGLDDGALSLESLFRMGDAFDLRIGHVTRHFVVCAKQPSYFLADESCKGQFRYQLNGWMPFNRENYKVWLDIAGLAKKISLLDSILRGNILSLYKAFEVFFPREIHAVLLDLEQRSVTYKGVRMLAFDAQIETDVALPVHLGIGKGVSHGFGVVEELLLR